MKMKVGMNMLWADPNKMKTFSKLPPANTKKVKKMLFQQSVDQGKIREKQGVKVRTFQGTCSSSKGWVALTLLRIPLEKRGRGESWTWQRFFIRNFMTMRAWIFLIIFQLWLSLQSSLRGSSAQCAGTTRSTSALDVASDTAVWSARKRTRKQDALSLLSDEWDEIINCNAVFINKIYLNYERKLLKWV